MPKPRILAGDPPWLIAAIHHYGVHEVDGPGSHPVIAEAYAAAGVKEPARLDDSTTAWCSAFECLCFVESGLPGTKSLAGRSWLKRGPRIEADGPLPRGAVAVFRYDNNPNHGHVANVLKDHGERIEVIGGNQRNAVNTMFWPRAALIGAVWPRDWPMPQDVPLPRPRPAIPQETEEADQELQRPDPQQPDDPGPDDRPASASPAPWYRRLWLRWVGGGGFGYLGLAGLTDWQIAAVLIAGGLVLLFSGVGAVMLFIGPDGRAAVRGWIVRQFRS